MREDQILPHLAVMAILLNGHASSQTAGSGTLKLATPASTADLIDQLRTMGVIVTYDPDTRTIRTDEGHPIVVTAAAGR